MQESSAVRAFIESLPREVREELRAIARTVQEMGPGVLEHSRDRTFHYPYPTSRYPTDAELKGALKALGSLEVTMVGEGEGRFRLKYADDVASALALRKHDEQRLGEQLELARDGSIAFVNFATRALHAYIETRGFSPTLADSSE